MLVIMQLLMHPYMKWQTQLNMYSNNIYTMPSRYGTRLGHIRTRLGYIGTRLRHIRTRLCGHVPNDRRGKTCQRGQCRKKFICATTTLITHINASKNASTL